MGATGWNYFVPYQADVSAALQRLRENVFARGEYSAGTVVTKAQLEAALKVCGSEMQTEMKDFAAKAADPSVPEVTRKKFAALAGQLKQLEQADVPASQPSPKPRTIQELLESRAESGTHSILDITRISPTTGFAVIAPLPKSKLAEIFGTETPTRLQIEGKYRAGALEPHTGERWQGIYIIAYRDREPDEIFFAGCSGD